MNRVDLSSYPSQLITDEQLTRFDSCCVCFDAFTAATQVQTLPCGHFFHAHCLENWTEHSATCPFCRFQLPSTVPTYPQAFPALNDYFQRLNVGSPFASPMVGLSASSDSYTPGAQARNRSRNSSSRSRRRTPSRARSSSRYRRNSRGRSNSRHRRH